MRSREKIIAAVNRRIPDSVPLTLAYGHIEGSESRGYPLRKGCCISSDGAFVFSDGFDVSSTQDTSQTRD